MVIQLLHPIAHDGFEYGRGLYEIGRDLGEDIAQHFLKKLPRYARLYTPDAAVVPGTIKVAAARVIPAPVGMTVGAKAAMEAEAAVKAQAKAAIPLASAEE
jgi:hypothetical protein